MGYYINKTSKGVDLNARGKASQLIADGATKLTGPPIFQENLVCVVENGPFDAAGYCYCEKEFQVFNIFDGRPKTWLIHPEAKQLSGYKQ